MHWEYFFNLISFTEFHQYIFQAMIANGDIHAQMMVVKKKVKRMDLVRNADVFTVCMRNIL
jgi:hypothetical protein